MRIAPAPVSGAGFSTQSGLMVRDDALRFANADVRENIEDVVSVIRLEVERLRGLKGQ